MLYEPQVGDTVYNVKSAQFAGGAKGDGATDDRASINAAFAAVEAAGGGEIYFPKGTYLISDAISRTIACKHYKVTLAAGAIIKADSSFPANTRMFFFQDAGTPIEDVSIVFEGEGTIDGRLMAPVTSGVGNVLDYSSDNVTYFRCEGIKITTGDLVTTSSTNLTPAEGDNTLATAVSLRDDKETFVPNQNVLVCSQSDPTGQNFIAKVVTAGAGTATELVVNIADSGDITGSGAHNDWIILPNSGDSLIGIAEGTNAVIRGCRLHGAVDAGIYLSGDSTETFGENALIEGNTFRYCTEVAVTSKRKFRGMKVINNSFFDCNIGASTAAADTTKVPGIDNSFIGNQFIRCGRPIANRWSDGAIITGNMIIDFGRNKYGVATSEKAIQLGGSSYCEVGANTIQVRDWSLASGAIGISVESHTVDATEQHSTYNTIHDNVIDMDTGTAIKEEDVNNDYNDYNNNKFPGTKKHVQIYGLNSTGISSDGALHTLNNLADLIVWLDAVQPAQISYDGSNLVDTWTNLGLAGDATQATAGEKPLFTNGVINGLPVIDCYHDATFTELEMAHSSVMDGKSHVRWVVFERHTDMGADESIICRYSGGAIYRLRIQSADDKLNYYSPTTGTATSAAALATDTPYIARLRHIKDDLHGLKVNDASEVLDVAVTTPAAANAVMEIGSQADSVPFGGYIGEIIELQGPVPPQIMRGVDLYLSRKWGITV